MNATTTQLLDAALTLNQGDRVELVEALIASLEPPEPVPFDVAWQPVIERRAAEVRSGQVTPVPWAEVKRQARE